MIPFLLAALSEAGERVAACHSLANNPATGRVVGEGVVGRLAREVGGVLAGKLAEEIWQGNLIRRINSSKSTRVFRL